MKSSSSESTTWDVDDPVFWAESGRSIAWRTLVLSTISLTLSFCVWFMWSAITVYLNDVGFALTRQQLFWLTATPVILGSFLRIPFGTIVSSFGSRNSYAAVTALLLVPTVATALAVSNPDTPFWVLMTCSALTGIAGANFSTSMGVVNLWFPKERKGTALGINGFGNIGVTVAQFTIPAVIAVPFLMAPGGTNLYLGNAAWIWVPFILLCTAGLWFGTRNFPAPRKSFASQMVAGKHAHTWILSMLYFLTFGCFVAMGASLPLVINEVFASAPGGAPKPMLYAPWALAVATCARPVGGWMADKFGAGNITALATGVMALGGFSLYFFLEAHQFTGFFVLILVICTASGLGNGSVFKIIPHVLHAQAGAAIGIVSCIGAFGGYFPPLLLGWTIDRLGSPAIAYNLMGGFAVACFVLNYVFYFRKSSPSRC